MSDVPRDPFAPFWSGYEWIDPIVEMGGPPQEPWRGPSMGLFQIIPSKFDQSPGGSKPMSTRDQLIARARELGCFERPEEHTDKQLLDAIKAEEAAKAWLGRLDNLSSDEAKRDAIRRLSDSMTNADTPPRTIRGRQGPTGRR